MELVDEDALGLAAMVSQGEISALELVDATITRIEALNPRLGAVIHDRFEEARLEARAPAEGPFSGVPFLLKDLGVGAMAGQPLACGSRGLKGHKGRQDSEIVRRLRAAGMIVVGRTNTPEFGLLPTTEPDAFGPTRNPWDEGRIAGGSSGGSAAAVAARIVPMAQAGDGGGSIRIPASCCGIFGIKPTRGRTPTGPDHAEIWSGLNVDHVVSRTVRDSAAMLDVLAGATVGDLHSPPAPEGRYLDEVDRDPGVLDIACSTEPMLPSSVHPDCVRAVEDVAAMLEDLGHRVRWTSPPLDGHRFASCFLRVVAANTAAQVRAFETERGKKFAGSELETGTRLAAKLGEAISGGETLDALAELRAMAREVLRFSESTDLILQPTVASPPPKLGFLHGSRLQGMAESALAHLPTGPLLRNPRLLDRLSGEVYSFIPWTPVYNVSGQPSMSVPLSWNDEGLPVGTMFTANLGREDLLFRVAAQLERARPWRERRATISA